MESPRISLLITAYDELLTVGETLKNVGHEIDYSCLVQSDAGPGTSMDALAHYHGLGYRLLPNLASTGIHPLALPAHAITRNYATLFTRWWPELNDVDYVVALTGDTKLFHLHGIRKIIQRMQKHNAELAVSKAIGQEFHAATMDVAGGQEGGRIQSLTCPDFMPQLFVVAVAALVDTEVFGAIPVTNPWCSEQCLGDAWMEAHGGKQYVFSNTAYGFSDGVVYHAQD
jgi:hypothetical protein